MGLPEDCGSLPGSAFVEDMSSSFKGLQRLGSGKGLASAD